MADAPAEHTVRRLHRWRSASDSGFAHRLAAVGLGETDLLGLLDEPVDRAAARLTRPGWADLAERIVGGGAGGPAAAPDPHQPWSDTFAVPLWPFVGVARERITEAVSGRLPAGTVDLDAVLAGLTGQLAQRLVRLSARTMVLELNVARVSGRLAGDTPRERFADFARQLATGPALAALFTEYPVLARLLGQAVQQAAEADAELLCRFAADRPAIVAVLLGGIDPGQLVAVDTTGDTHCGGRAVAVLRFADGRRVVYKPRLLELHEQFGEVVRWLTALLPELALRVPDVLVRGGYGWVAFVDHRPCADAAEVDLFYRRLGVLLALLYAVDGTDIHYENVIACVDQPVLVDVETLFHPTIPLPGALADPAADALERSVARTALLPRLLIGEHGAVDISGLGGDRGVRSPDSVVWWRDAGTDLMRLVREPVEFHGGVNRPRLDGHDVDPGDYQAALLTGFRTGYDAIVEHRAELVGLLASCAAAPIRVVVRSTQVYATLLDESTHPDLLRDALDHERAFDPLWDDAGSGSPRTRLLDDEVRDLGAGDVPIFAGLPGSTSLWSAHGERPEFFDHTGLDRVTAKIAEMGAVGRREQEWLITAALATRTGPVEHRGVGTVRPSLSATPPDPQRLLAASGAIGDDIVMRALHQHGRANWLGIELVDERHWAVLPMGASLASGYCGVALYLAQLAAVSGTSRYADLARQAIQPLPRLVSQLAADPELVEIVGPGAHAGLGGVCYAIARLATLLGDSELTTVLATAVDAMAAANGQGAGGRTADLATGWAGGLATMLAVHAETGLPATKPLADHYATLLTAEGWGDIGPGFAYGRAGIEWALHRHGDHGDHGDPCGSGDPDGSGGSGDPGDGVDLSWCSGEAGAVLAGSTASALAGRTTGAGLLTNRRPLRDHSLCHGELGVLEALGALARDGHEQAAVALRQSAAHVVATLDRHGPYCGTPSGVPTPGLLSGLAGIGYGLLRLGFPDQVPSVLLLESAR